MEPIPSTSSGGNATDAPTAGPSFTPPTPVQPSNNNCIDNKLQSVSESEYRDEPEKDLSGSSSSEEEIPEVMEPIPTSSSGGNAMDSPTAGPSSTPPTPVQPSDNNCVDLKLQAVSKSEYRDEPDQKDLSGSPSSEEEILEVGLFGSDLAYDTDTEQRYKRTDSFYSNIFEVMGAFVRIKEDAKNENKTLVEACRDNDVGAVRKLLTEGHSIHETSEEGESLLFLACSAGYYELVQYLLSMHANVEDQGIKGDCTPLMKAASSGFVEIVRLLLTHGAVVNASSSTGNTPLMYACAGGHVDTVTELLSFGANVEDHNENGHTPLMEAASAGHVGVAKILINNGAGINTHSNELKESALTLASYKGHEEMVRFLLSAGADQGT